MFPEEILEVLEHLRDEAQRRYKGTSECLRTLPVELHKDIKRRLEQEFVRNGHVPEPSELKKMWSERYRREAETSKKPAAADVDVPGTRPIAMPGCSRSRSRSLPKQRVCPAPRDVTASLMTKGSTFMNNGAVL